MFNYGLLHLNENCDVFGYFSNINNDWLFLCSFVVIIRIISRGDSKPITIFKSSHEGGSSLRCYVNQIEGKPPIHYQPYKVSYTTGDREVDMRLIVIKG